MHISTTRFRLFLAALLLVPSLALADDCGDLAQRFVGDRDAMKIGELDDLKACVGDLMRDKASGLTTTAHPAYDAPAKPGNAVADPVSSPISRPITSNP